MTNKVNLEEFEASFPELASAVKQGEEVVIEQSGQTVMKIVGVETRKRKVKFGLGAEQFKDFDWDEIEASGHWVWQERGKCSFLDESSFPQPLQLPPTNL
jgi:antitoxin (DNA-binding transcriptional repressor) of toxin-antitoxin stability system